MQGSPEPRIPDSDGSEARRRVRLGWHASTSPPQCPWPSWRSQSPVGAWTERELVIVRGGQTRLGAEAVFPAHGLAYDRRPTARPAAVGSAVWPR